MNIFITGANGFIGLHLKEYLQHKHNNYSLFTPSSQELDLAHEKQLDNYIISNKIDIIIHLANKGGGRDITNMKNITEYNLRIFFNIVKHEKNVKKIISFGSGAEYGKHKPIVNVTEEESTPMPLDAYGFYKSITSKYIERANNIVQLRIFGAYGEYENYRFRFISNAIVKNLLHLPITINKNVFFDYIYIDDLTKIITWFINNEAKEKIYNVVSGTKIDLITLANTINETSDFKSDINILKDGLNNEYTANNSRLLSELGDLNFTEPKEAIIKMRAYFSYNLKNLDKAKIINEENLKRIDTMWIKGK
ncbi:MAG TPA: NAD(P)-dependent oxidoreductase [Arcobacter sp.]|nr:NAD(P)-dependent oxidoreductase [Arcobacter sp.]